MTSKILIETYIFSCKLRVILRSLVLRGVAIVFMPAKSVQYVKWKCPCTIIPGTSDPQNKQYGTAETLMVDTILLRWACCSAHVNNTSRNMIVFMFYQQR